MGILRSLDSSPEYSDTRRSYWITPAFVLVLQGAQLRFRCNLCGALLKSQEEALELETALCKGLHMH